MSHKNLNIQKSSILLGSLPVEFDFNIMLDKGFTFIASGRSQKITPKIQYSVCNNEVVLQDLINSGSYSDALLLVPRKIYVKYIFFEAVDCLPYFPEIAMLNIDPDSLSNESLALTLSCWMEHENIFVFGWDLENEIEKQRFLTIASLFPHCKIHFVRKPNPQKIGIFKDVPNITVIDYKEIKKLLS